MHWPRALRRVAVLFAPAALALWLAALVLVTIAVLLSAFWRPIGELWNGPQRHRGRNHYYCLPPSGSTPATIPPPLPIRPTEPPQPVVQIVPQSLPPLPPLPPHGEQSAGPSPEYVWLSDTNDRIH